MVKMKVYTYLNKPATKSYRFVLIMHYHQAQSMGLGPNIYKIGNKSCFIPKVGKFYVGKGYL